MNTATIAQALGLEPDATESQIRTVARAATAHAISSARSDVQCILQGYRSADRSAGPWLGLDCYWDTAEALCEDDRAAVDFAVAYLDALGLIERHPEDPALVRLADPADTNLRTSWGECQ